MVKYRGEEYRVGNSVFLLPGAFNFKNSVNGSVAKKKKNKEEKVRIDLYAQTCIVPYVHSMKSDAIYCTWISKYCLSTGVSSCKTLFRSLLLPLIPS